MVFLAIALLLGAQADDLELRRYPAVFDQQSEMTFIRRFADAAKLKVEAAPLQKGEPIPNTPLVLHRIDVSGGGGIGDVAFFLDLFQRRDWRASDLESFRIGADSSFTARFALPVIDLDSPHRLTEQMADRYRAGRIATVVALLESVPENRAIRLTALEAGKDVLMRGVAIGEAARQQVRSWLEGRGFGGSTMTLADEGACRPFRVEVERGREGERMSVLSRPVKSLDASDVALCKAESPRHLGTLSARGKGPIDLRLEHIDVGALAYVLHDLTGENFVVDSDVTGTVNVEARGATAAELIAAIPSAGLHVSAGPLRRVSASRGPTPPDDYSGEAVSFSLQRAPLAGVLCLFGTMTGLEVIAPETLQDRVTLFVRDLPWDRVMKDVIYSAGLAYSIEQTRVYVGNSKTNGKNACDVASAAPDTLAGLHLTLDKVSASDLDLLGHSDGAAWAYAPWQSVVKLEPGAKLFDSKVVSIDPKGVTFEAEGRPFEIPFGEVPVPALVGAWQCLSGPCFDPQIEFGIYEKVRTFSSWLHERPAARGTWSVEGSTVTVSCCSNTVRTFGIVKVDRKELVLREGDGNEPARYRRIED